MMQFASYISVKTEEKNVRVEKTALCTGALLSLYLSTVKIVVPTAGVLSGHAHTWRLISYEMRYHNINTCKQSLIKFD